MTGDAVLPFQRDVPSMSPQETLSHLAYLRRTIEKRDTERRETDLASLTDGARNTLAEVAKSDREMLATLDKLEASIRAQLEG